MWASKLCKSVCTNPLITAPGLFTKAGTNLCYFTRPVSFKFTATNNFKLLKKSFVKLNLPKIRTLANEVPKISPKHKIVGYWLLGCSGLVYGTLLLGGFTRLTESGLSMVTWRLASEKYPKNENDWLEEFNKYKEYPEFIQLKPDLTLEEFKKIWITEFTHRTMGRVVGISILLPGLFFWVNNFLTPPLKKRVLFSGVLVVAQGLLGWYMVRSGLEGKFNEPGDIPRVSQHRLAAHLGLALTLYTSLLWTALDLILPAQTIAVVTAGATKIKKLTHICKGMVFLTALSGALVAGLDAGLVYSSFPKMGDSWIPSDIFALTPKARNFTDNPTTVQFDHRILGISTFFLIVATWILSRKQNIPYRARMALNTLLGAACLQVILGVSTLVHHVPLEQALSHQSGSVVLLSTAIWASHELKWLKHIPK